MRGTYGSRMVIGLPFDDVVAAAQAGADWAFVGLYRDLNPRLLRYFSAQAPAAAEDLAADTWLAAAGSLRSFVGGEDEFRAWLFTIGRRRLIQHWRYAGRRPIQLVDPETLKEQAGTDDTETVAMNLAGAEAAVRTITATLSPDQAEVVLLRVLGGLGVDQGAAILGKRAGTVRVLQHRALRRLAKTFSLGIVNAVSPERDMQDMPRRFALDDATADRLLSGTMSPADAPPAYEGVASLLQTVIEAPVDKELRREAEVAAMAAAAAAAVVAPAAVAA